MLFHNSFEYTPELRWNILASWWHILEFHSDYPCRRGRKFLGSTALSHTVLFVLNLLNCPKGMRHTVCKICRPTTRRYWRHKNIVSFFFKFSPHIDPFDLLIQHVIVDDVRIEMSDWVYISQSKKKTNSKLAKTSRKLKWTKKELCNSMQYFENK